MLDNMQKYIASTTLSEPLPWVNSPLLSGAAAETVARLKEESDTDLVIMGSGELVQWIMQANLVDRSVLLIHPLVLGSGRRLFPQGGVAALFDVASRLSLRERRAIHSFFCKEWIAQSEERFSRKDSLLCSKCALC